MFSRRTKVVARIMVVAVVAAVIMLGITASYFWCCDMLDWPWGEIRYWLRPIARTFVLFVPLVAFSCLLVSAAIDGVRWAVKI